MTISDITETLEQTAPLILQESYDNSGLLVGDAGAECTGALLCVDATPERVREAAGCGCNLLISHHPVIFRPLRRLTGETLPQRTVAEAIRLGVAIYACHTNLDNAPGGVSVEIARRIGLTDITPLMPGGTGAVGNLPAPLSPSALADIVKSSLGSPVVRTNRYASDSHISRVALCGGSGSEFIPDAVRAGAQAYITSDTRYHDFVDYADTIFIVDTGHYESEKCTTSIFQRIITEKFPNFAVRISNTESNPINYM